jgi:hypothetical protein
MPRPGAADHVRQARYDALGRPRATLTSISSGGHPAPQSGCRNDPRGRREQSVPPTGSQPGVPLEDRGEARTARGAPAGNR